MSAHDAEVRAETLREAAAVAGEFTARYPDMDAMKAAGLIGPFTMAAAIRDELCRMADEAGEKASATAPTATPRSATGWHGARAQDRRLAQLLDAIRTQAGRWHTSKVMAIYRALGIEAPTRATARGDLAALHAAGHLDRHDEPDHRFYTLRRRADALASPATNDPEAES